MNYKLLTAVLLFIPVFIIIGCRTKDENKKTVPVQASEKAGSITSPSQNISIHDAALNGQSDDIMRILEGGADINAKDEDGRTALMYSAFNGHAGIMEKLIQKGASVNLTDNYGRTALMFASSGPYPAAVKLLLTHQANPDIADKDEHFTALMYAAAEGQTEVARILLTFKADPKLKDIDGDNALTFAKNNGHNDIVSLLQPFLK